MTIIAGFLAGIAVLFVRRRQTWLFVTLGIAACVLLVGASASVVRAGITDRHSKNKLSQKY